MFWPTNPQMTPVVKISSGELKDKSGRRDDELNKESKN